MKRELKCSVISLVLLVSDKPQSSLAKHGAVTGGQLYLLCIGRKLLRLSF